MPPVPVPGRPVPAAQLAVARALGQALRRIARERSLATYGRRLATGHGRLGFCAACDRVVVFVALSDWLRDDLRCLRCNGIPRQRALLEVLGEVAPDWRRRRIHESSPDGPGSDRMARECPGYDASQFWPDVARGTLRDGVRCEDLTALTFADASLDLFVTQDVFEHVLDPEPGFAEIARVLRPGGLHVFTVPWYRGRATHVRARPGADGRTVEHRAPPDFHSNPVDPTGSLVATEWGDDLADVIRQASGMTTTVHTITDRARGIDGAFRDVFVSRRAAAPDGAAPRRPRPP
jgi:SAM-dependent methyltransferase